jgi:tetratricopeptide (TPR) repeat protein
VSTVPAALDAGRTAYGDLEYERGVELLQRSLAQETLSPEQKRDAYLYLGLCLASLGREEEAQLAFLQLLDLSPDFRLDNRVYSPTIVTVFESALEERSRRLRVGDNLPPVLQVRDIDQPVLYRREVTVAARVADDQGVAAVQLFYRRSGESGYSFLPMTAQGTGVYAAAIPGFMADHEGLEYYVLALDRAGNASLTGNAALPLQLKVQPGSETKPWYKKWWVWAIIGAAAGAGAAIGVTLSNGGGGDGGGTATLQVGLQ